VVGSSDGGVLLTGDDFGLVNVFSFPNPEIDHSRSYSAHSEHVTRVAFSKDNQFVFSIGG
jgi:WD40 repeat protein